MESDYQKFAVMILRTMQQVMTRYPSAFGYLLGALDLYLSEAKEIALIGDADSHEVRLFIEEIYSRFLPNKVVAGCEPNDRQAIDAIKLLADRAMVDGKATAYVCRNYTCLAPATTPQELAERLED